MIGPLIIVLVLLVVIPVGVFLAGGVLAGILGYLLKKDIDDEYAGTEYLELG